MIVVVVAGRHLIFSEFYYVSTLEWIVKGLIGVDEFVFWILRQVQKSLRSSEQQGAVDSWLKVRLKLDCNSTMLFGW